MFFETELGMVKVWIGTAPAGFGPIASEVRQAQLTVSIRFVGQEE